MVSSVMTVWSLDDAVDGEDVICWTMRSMGTAGDALFCLVRPLRLQIAKKRMDGKEKKIKESDRFQ